MERDAPTPVKQRPIGELDGDSGRLFSAWSKVEPVGTPSPFGREYRHAGLQRAASGEPITIGHLQRAPQIDVAVVANANDRQNVIAYLGTLKP